MAGILAANMSRRRVRTDQQKSCGCSDVAEGGDADVRDEMTNVRRDEDGFGNGSLLRIRSGDPLLFRVFLSATRATPRKSPNRTEQHECMPSH